LEKTVVPSTELDGDYDYIVVGAGSAGCVVANRLSTDRKNRVLVLEAGGNDNWIWFHIPVGYLFAIGNPRSDWMFETESEAGLNGRSLKYPRGKVVGGSSAINAMISMRGQASDYDHWRQLGLTGWAGTTCVRSSGALTIILWVNLNITVSAVSGAWSGQE
jgi:choline dehydrogenase